MQIGQVRGFSVLEEGGEREGKGRGGRVVLCVGWQNCRLKIERKSWERIIKGNEWMYADIRDCQFFRGGTIVKSA